MRTAEEQKDRATLARLRAALEILDAARELLGDSAEVLSADPTLHNDGIAAVRATKRLIDLVEDAAWVIDEREHARLLASVREVGL